MASYPGICQNPRNYGSIIHMLEDAGFLSSAASVRFIGAELGGPRTSLLLGLMHQMAKAGFAGFTGKFRSSNNNLIKEFSRHDRPRVNNL